ncbi:uncharacterized protein [Physcomitrium patens]|uniref:uncharacterized protein isoform X2 n=1 Tax=Physcomitrium patens TaxID=3218 RepID=UPI003CCE3A65
MDKFTWRFSDRLPGSIQATLLFVSLMLVLSVVSFEMLSESTWEGNFGTLLMGVSSFVINLENTTIVELAPPPFAENYPIFAEPHAAPPTAQDLAIPAPAVESGNYSVISSSAEVEASSEKFMMPILSFQVGAGNQFMEYVSAAVISHSLNRTLCLSPFFQGPSRHTGRVVKGLGWEDRYEVSSLTRFTRVATMDRCLKECNYTLDAKWMLKASREPQIEGWKKYPRNNESWNLDWNYVRWTRPEDIFATLGNRNERCVGMLGLFPGLRWRGAFLAVSAFLRPAPRINQLADKLQEYALGEHTRYLAVHWRFEESECGPHNIGLCFVRCQDGSVIDTGLRSEANEWHEASQIQCNRDGHFRGVTLDRNDILDAIQDRALNHSVNTIYFATDGWMRGPQGVALVKEIVESLRKRGLVVVGLWKLPGLPNFADGTYFKPAKVLGGENTDLNGAQIALVEQELCVRAISFMGSGQSTWSLSVFRVRLARRRVQQIVEAAKLMLSVNLTDPKVVDKLIYETLLKDEHAAGLHCRYMRFMKRAEVNETTETYADEYPDGWLDLEACEGRIGKGGRCEVAKCF